MGIAYRGYCYATPQAAAKALQSEFRHEHEPVYTQFTIYQGADYVRLRHLIYPNGPARPSLNGPIYELPTCPEPGPLKSIRFNPANLNPVDVVNIIGHGFLFLSVPLIFIWGCRKFLKFLSV